MGDDRAARWPAWFAPVAFVTAFGAAIVLGGTVITAAQLLTGDDDPPALATLLATLIQDVLLVATAFYFASRVGPVGLADLGLRVAPLRRVAKVTALGALAFLAFSLLYSALVRPDGEQETLDALGADEGFVLLVASGVLVVLIAPFVEELFFRGFMYRALRNRFSVAGAAVINGIIFGSVHFSGSDTLDLIPILAVLGVIFCVLYERARTLYAPIALHAINNAVAFTATGPDGAEVLGPILLAVALASTGVATRRPVHDVA